MQKSALRILSCFLAMIVLFLSVLPFQAVGTEYVSKESFWNWVASSSNIAQGILSHIPIGSRDNVCANSDDGYHHSNGFIKDGQDGYFRCVCKDCGQEFRGYASDLAPAYDNYVETLPATGYTSTGGLIWYPTWKDWWFDDRTALCSFFENVTPDPLSRSCNGSLKFSWSSVSLRVDLKIPFNGLYRTYEGFRYDYRYVDNNGQIVSKVAVEQGPFEWKRQSAGNLFSSTNLTVSAVSSAYISGTFTLPAFEAVPDTVVDKDTTYSTTTRPTSITG